MRRIGLRPLARIGGRRRVTLLLLTALVALGVTGSALAAVKGELSFQQRVAEFDIGTATALAVSPDGDHLYATSSFPGSVTALALNGLGDDYTFIETERDGFDDAGDVGPEVAGISGAADLAISPDGKHVYVAGGTGESAIAIFARNATTGALTFTGTATSPGDLTWPDGVAVSPDGDYIYAVSGNDDTVVGFKRDSGDGSLAVVDVEKDAVNDGSDPGGVVDGMQGAFKVTVAPDGEAVYVGTDLDDTLVAFSRTPATGELSYVEFEQDGVDDGGPAGTADGLNSVHDVLVSGDDGYVYATSRLDSAVSVFERDDTTQELDFIEVERNGVDDASDGGGTVTGLGSPRQTAFSTEAEQRNLYVSANSSDSIAVFRRNVATGRLNFLESEAAGDGSSAVAVAGNNGHVYGAAADEGGVSVFQRGAALGALSFVRARPEFRIDEPTGLAMAPNGDHMVVLAENDEALHSFARDASTGTVELLDTEIEGVDDPSDPAGAPVGLYESSSVRFSPDGKFVYVTAYSIYSVAVFSFNQTSGELTYIETEADGVDSGDGGGTVEGLYEPYDVAISPDGGSLYAPGNSDDAIAAFSRDASTGRIVFAEAELDGAGGGPGLQGADSVDVSPDGKHVYVGAQSDRAVSVFSRDASTSELTFVEVEQDEDLGGTLDLGQIEDVLVSPDGKQVYAAAGSQLHRFTRNANNGRLTLAETEEDGVNDPTDTGGAVDGLSGVALAISADGEELYVGSVGQETVLTFSRDTSSGELSFLEVEREGVDDPTDAGPTVSGLNRLTGLAVSPDDRFLYTTAERSNALAIFSREDDFVAPQTTIDSGPADGGVTKDSTPTFTYSASEPGSSFECSTDGAPFGACVTPLPELADGEHSFAVAATDAAGNVDPSPAERTFTVDTVVSGAKVKAAKTQKQKGSKIKVVLKLKAKESATGVGKGKIKIGKKSYKLKKLTKDLKPGKTKKLKLKPKKSKDKKKIAKQLRKGKKATAKLTGKITDEAKNSLKKKPSVKLKAKG